MQHQICQNIEAKFPANSCKVLTAFSIFDVDLLPSQSSPTFSVLFKLEVCVKRKSRKVPRVEMFGMSFKMI